MRESAAMHVAIYLDEDYAVPATVLVLSLLRHLGSAAPLQLHVFGVGLTDETRRTMAASWPDDRLVIHWIDVDFPADAAGCQPTGYLSRAAYARLLIDRYLPVEVERVLTIDADGLILDDITKLWRLAPNRSCLMAVRDSFVRLLADDPSDFIQGDRQRHAAPYFNSGLMLIDTRRWRDEAVSAKCLDLALRHPGSAVIGDNSLLNAVLAGDWEPLPLRWNCNSRHLAIHSYPSLRGAVHPQDEVTEALRKPGFLHFVSQHKPWHEGRYHPDRRLYMEYLAQTAWSDQVFETRQPRTEWRSFAFPCLCHRQAREVGRRWQVAARPAADAVHLVRRLLGL
jgi:lipopolysaccharide biosynthesis glycosyltransferase